ncbi:MULTISPECIES: class I SAM-dependent methyltransferase [Acidianus]|uniref:SAM-dependent methyltransferase n=1 Tax=Candidatus Acidianus copahuensis TaxID=1160895 RepID=A0A031LLN5_9CREN|nr:MULTISPECIES: class I SAM-dependent methyltransferase [Acidianus]EZQ06568.1 SAM-dependent methyltransferase [Candidatus Acidianus copahuensis]NON63230.1 methyltransferase domain-containing protein [Acidianus sp. RZ1]
MSDIYFSIFETDFYINEILKVWEEGKKWAEWIDQLKKKYNLGNKVLDVPCGVGRVSYFLSKIGYDITGVDISEKMISLSKKNVEKGKFLRGDMRSLKSVIGNEKFDIVINIFNSLGFLSEEDDLQILDSIKNSTSGIAIINLDNRDYIIYNRPENYYAFVPPYLVENYSVFDPFSSRMKIKRIYKNQKGEVIGSLEYSQRYYSLHEIIAMLKKLGFKVLDVYSGHSWKKFDVTDPEMTIVVTAF